MKPELKLGRRVLTGDNKPALYINKCYDGYHDGHNVLMPKGIVFTRHVKIDPTSEPMNGDEVEVSDDGSRWYPPRLYIGWVEDGWHFAGDNNYNLARWKYVRLSQSKRDRIKEAIRSWQESSTVPMYDELADQIDKIYTEDK